MTLPITAKCVCPSISIVNKEIQLGEIFLNYQYTTNLILRNESIYPAKFEYVDCDDESNLEAFIAPAKFSGIIAPKGDSEVPFYIKPIQLGHMKFVRMIRIAGSDDPPLKFSMTCACIGPKIKLSSNNIDFGVINVLQETDSILTITNDSLIPAEFKAEIESSSGLFSLKHKNGSLEPGQSIEFPITAKLDDSLEFSGKLTLLFRHLTPIVLPIHAKGTGSGLVASIDMNKIDMEYIFTGVPILKKFQIQNFSRRAQEIKWCNLKPTVVAKSEQTPFFTFKVEPEQYIIQPKEIIEYYFTFSCNSPCIFSVKPVCEVTVNKKKFELFKPHLKGEFVKPTVEFSENTLTFTYIHDIEKEEELTGGFFSREVISPSQQLLVPMSYPNSLKNVAELPLVVSARVNPPFFVEPCNFLLEPDELAEFEIIFKPEFKKDFTSQTIDSKIIFSFEENPQQYFINLRALLIFPNLSFTPDVVNFGSMLKHTEESRTIKVTNTSAVPVTFIWELLPKQKGVEISKIFDVYPIRGEVGVNETIDIHVTFFALDRDYENSFEGIAVCHVIGGPDYVINLSGSSAAVEYQLGPKTIDFGTKYFAENLHSSITLTNSSDIPLSYQVKIPKHYSMSQLTVEPSSGTLAVGNTQKFNVNTVPGFPSFLKDSFLIQIGKVVDEEINVQVNCAFPQIQTTFPRAEDDAPSQMISQQHNFEPSYENFTKIESQILMERLHELFKNATAYRNQLKKMTMTNFSKITNFNGFVLSRFFIDFGSLTLGEIRNFQYFVKVVSPYPISFEFDTHTIEGTGFAIEPTSFVDIPPETELEINVSFDATRRTLKTVSEEIYKIPIMFSADLASMLTLSASLSMPEISMTESHFNFETTLIGQTRTMSFQVANPIKIPVEFIIDDAQSPGQRNKADNGVFTATPKTGILLPASFQNIDITFAPQLGKNYSMTFPITVKHNSTTMHFTVTGTGVELKLQFVPPRLKFPTIKPYEEPLSSEFEIVNPNEYPIEVFAPQFDLEVENEILSRKFKEIQDAEMGNDNTEELRVTMGSSLSLQQDKVKKFSMCIIVNGPSKSGKTTVSRFISEILDGFPIISLKELWKDLTEQNCENPEDFINVFTTTISTNECVRGFIIDGLDGLPEPPETEPFLTQQMKQKHPPENPFTPAPGENKTSYETALKYVLEGLSGQYVFQVALQAKAEAIQKHQQAYQEEEKKQKENEDNEEIERLLNMDEEDYLKLSEEEQRIIDQKRIEYRKRILQAEGIDLMEVLSNAVKPAPIPEPVTKNGKRGLGNSLKNASALKSTASIKSPRGSQRQVKKPPPKRGATALSDPNDFSIACFQFTLGRIAKMIENGGITFQAFDPEVITEKKCETALRQQINSVLLDSNLEIEEIQKQITEFLPNLDDIKNKALKRMIPEPKNFVPRYTSDEPNLELLPALKQFTIVNKEPPGEFPVFEKFSSNGKNRRKSVKPVIDTSLTDDLDIMKYTKRYLLEPGQRETITVEYQSEEIGSFNGNLMFSIDSCRTTIFNFPVKGMCIYPDVQRDPESIFEHIVPSLTNKTSYAYVDELEEFHFGALVIGKERTKNQPFQYRQSMKFVNDSPFETEVSAFLRESGPKSIWKLEDSSLVIPPGESKEMFICFHPVVPETYKNVVDIYVKDNPEPFSYTFVGVACSPSLELSTTSLDFEKLLLKQEKKMEIILNNPNPIPAIWRLNKPNQLQGLFSFSDVEGTVPARNKGKLYVTYTSSKPQVIKKQIQLEVLDNTKTKTYNSHHITLMAESFDVTFDFLYPKGFDHINIGTMKVGQSKTFNCTLKNRGKYPSNFSFAFSKPAYARAITVKPDTGTLGPNEKPLNVVFTVCTNKVLHLNHQTACVLTVSDAISGTEMAKIDVKMTIDSVFSEYTIDQKELIDFGSLSTGKSTTKDWVITNVGSFPFDFEIHPKIDVVEPPSGAQNRQKRGRKVAAKPSPARGGKKGKLQVGFFSISQATGTIQPGASSTIKIDFGGSTAQKSDNGIILKISDVAPKDPAHKGLELRLIGNTYVPGIDVSDIEKIFTGQNLCLRYDILKNDTNAFLEDDQTFHFSPSILGKKTSIDILLRNIFPVPCTVDASVRPNANSKKKPDSNYPFKLSTESVVIPPLSNTSIQLFFSPTIEGNFTGIFKAEVRGSTDPTTKLLKFSVEGIATLPKLALHEDQVVKMTDKNGKPLFSFGKTLVNTKKEKHICIKNTGVIPARVSLAANSSKQFMLMNLDTNKEFIVEPQRMFDLVVLFAPLQTQRSEYSLLVNVLDNESSNFALNFVGEGFAEDIIFEGIPGDEGNLVIKDTVVGHVQTATFTMRNVCDNDVRFVWIENNDFHFSPRVGHLRKGKAKLIRVSFFTEKPVNYNNIKINCQWTKIELQDKDSPDWDDSMTTVKFVQRDSLLPQFGITPPALPDEKSRTLSGRKFPMRKPNNTFNRTNLSSARRNRKRNTPTPPNAPIVTEVTGDLVKVVEIKNEPIFTQCPGKCPDVALTLSAISDFIKYEISDTEIQFAATMMFESRITNVTVKNTGNIRFDYTWQTNKFTTLHSDYAKTHHSPFSVQPQTGFIEAGKETVFQIRFSPEEVDDFMSTLVCDIPFLTNNQPPPSIYVTGFSRRPLCHFNVDLSDYITAGRRHPDYTYPLPEGVRVIELFSSGIGKRSLKKFEVINATSHPYEINWNCDPEHKNEAIACETTNALVSSGTRYSIAFSYMPKSVKSVEALWIFTIPEHSITVPFLVVGRIMPK
ncbi:hypothetical protein TRFO_24017 [Tritrichomonas foetus]|uniref:MSP domain-containing protein n=1 Tax=Tritrichomonas foetus TaxID=1144522 RepID=A0A1J4K9V9_9EUKA|nr:hypothetical protein TRFO_24017 [Tritrichomonas foetus]|eukprot:OHT07738.1 hypothetical protein TRFO_24017 [Tritrichomonas foetus]